MATTTDLVDALYDRLPVLADCKGLAEALLDDTRSERHSDMDQAHLAALLAAALKRATEHSGARQKQVGHWVWGCEVGCIYVGMWLLLLAVAGAVSSE
jgi:hypothetical protein